jgi:hypothetical protein
VSALSYNNIIRAACKKIPLIMLLERKFHTVVVHRMKVGMYSVELFQCQSASQPFFFSPLFLRTLLHIPPPLFLLFTHHRRGYYSLSFVHSCYFHRTLYNTYTDTRKRRFYCTIFLHQLIRRRLKKAFRANQLIHKRPCHKE